MSKSMCGFLGLSSSTVDCICSWQNNSIFTLTLLVNNDDSKQYMQSHRSVVSVPTFLVFWLEMCKTKVLDKTQPYSLSLKSCHKIRNKTFMVYYTNFCETENFRVIFHSQSILVLNITWIIIWTMRLPYKFHSYSQLAIG